MTYSVTRVPHTKYDAIAAQQSKNAWYSAVKRTEARLLSLGFSADDAWRLAFGER